MSRLTAVQVLDLALAAGFSRAESNVMTVIAHYESGWDPNNVGDQTLSKYGSRGLWQIFTGAHSPSEFGLGHSGWTRALVAQLASPATNAHAARVVFKEQGFSAWSTYNSYHSDAAWAKLLAQVDRLTPNNKPPAAPVAKVVAKVPGGKGYLAAKGNANKRASVAIEFVKHEVASGSAMWKNLCAALVRSSYGISSNAWGAHTRTAASASHLAGPLHTWYTAPAGVPVYWTGGSTGAGHVAIADGRGNVWSNDFGPHGYIGDGRVRLIPPGAVTAHDAKLVCVGWGELFLGVRVYN